MAWIHTIEPEVADGQLADLYRAIGSARGGVASVHRAQSLHPRALRAHLELYKAVVFARSSLSRVQRERIAVIVSAANRCAYCVAHHAASLRQLGDDEVFVARIADGLVPDDLPPADAELLRWARRATVEPHANDREACERLRALGVDDRGVLDAALVAAYFNFVNRLVLTLGVDLEEGYERFCGDAPDPESETDV